MRYGLLGVFIWCCLSFVLHALDISPPKRPQNELGITLDYSLASSFPAGASSRAPRNFFWSSHIKFNGLVSQITDGQLWQLAFDAYSYIEEDAIQYGLGEKNLPGALTVLAWGNEIILASSQKGSNSFTYEGPRSEVSLSLERCQVEYLEERPNGRAQGHKNQGKCGEQMAAHLYYLSPTTQTKLRDQNAVIGTVGYDPVSKKFIIREPCWPPSNSHWGCQLFVKDQNLRVLSKSTPAESYVLQQLAGGVASKDQIQLCGTVRRF